MNISQIITTIYKGLLQFVPLFRVVWAISVMMGAVMFVIAFILKKEPTRKKSPWIVGGLGLFMMISSGTQLLASLF